MMIDHKLIFGITITYLLILFAIAYFVERKVKQGKNLTDNPLIYALSLAIYCTAWTFYGNVGLAATSSFLFLGVYIGPTLFFLFWRKVLSRLIDLRNEYNITSIADFISARYGKSAIVAAIVSLIALVGIVPYLSLQLHAIFDSYAVITTGSLSAGGVVSLVDLMLLLVVILFVIIFGLRSVDQAERHPGMVMVIAIQSVVKLLAFLCVGVFVTFVLNRGFGDIFLQISDVALPTSSSSNVPSYSLFMAYMVLSFSAILFLPRQFHMAVVENIDKRHLNTAAWLLPLYFIIITIFVFPVALVGILKGYDIAAADSFILLLPLRHGSAWLSILVFLGGLSAAMSMLMISSLTITTMVANYLVLPLLKKMRISGFFSKNLLLLRWLLVAAILFLAYGFEVKVGSAYMLVKIGMISFAAVLQFAPAAIGGLFWRKGTKLGAILGLSSGFLVWGYTALLPAVVKSGWISDAILQNGPFGLSFLRPEHLFGASFIDPLAQTVIFTLLVNIGFYILGSLMWQQSEGEKKNTYDFFNVIHGEESLVLTGYGQANNINLAHKIKVINVIFEKYLAKIEAEKATRACLSNVNILDKSVITISELLSLNNEVEKTLASYVGSPSACAELAGSNFFTKEEAGQLSDMYAEMTSELRLTPREISEKINFYNEKEKFLASHQAELENLVRQRTGSLEEKMGELTQWQHASVDRELKMIELKDEIKTLKKSLAKK